MDEAGERSEERTERRHGRRGEAADTATLRRRGFAVIGATFLLCAGWIWFEGRVGEAFDRASRAAPTRARTDPLVLAPGGSIRGEVVEAHLEAAGYEALDGPDAATGPEPGEYVRGPSEWRIGRRAFRAGGAGHPGGTIRIRLGADRRIASVVDALGAPLDRAVIEPVPIVTLSGEGGARVPVRLEELPDELVQAVLSVEDRRFFEHGGLDLHRILGALYANVRRGRVAQGGSTVTQQLVRTLFLDTERTLVRKAKEAALAIALERRRDKDRILEAYLNHVYLGHVDGDAVRGIGQAARAYFGKDASRLGLAEAALLAGMIRAPNLYSPHEDPEVARARRNLVLGMMAETGAIDPARRDRDRSEPLAVRAPARRPRFAPFFGDYLAAGLRTALRDAERDPRSAGLEVRGTVSPYLQKTAEEAVARGLEELERRYPYQVVRDGREPPLEAALVALDPRDGAVLAMVGGRDYEASQFNRAASARRQPGSAFKPVVLLAALAAHESRSRREEPYRLTSVVPDAPLSIPTDRGVWSPTNHDGQFRGAVTLRGALVSSRNLPFVRLGLEIGPLGIMGMARALGIESPLRPVPSLALGSSEVTLLELTAAYAVLAAGGVRTRPRAVREARIDARRVIPRARARRVGEALEAVVQWGTGRGVRDRGYLGPVAAKSGSTDDYRDAWFVGYTPELAVGVWVGFDDGKPVGLPGNVAALPIFADFLIRALGPSGRGRIE